MNDVLSSKPTSKTTWTCQLVLLSTCQPGVQKEMVKEMLSDLQKRYPNMLQDFEVSHATPMGVEEDNPSQKWNTQKPFDTKGLSMKKITNVKTESVESNPHNYLMEMLEAKADTLYYD